MNHKDIILFILIICVLYLLYKVNKIQKESFTSTSSGVTTPTNPVDEEIKNKIDRYLANRKEIPITESIKNLGIIAKKLQEESSLTVPGDFVVDGNLRVNGNIQLSKNIDGEDRLTTLSLEKSKITKELQEPYENRLLKFQEESHSLNIDSSIKFTNEKSNGLRFPLRNQTSQSAIYQKQGGHGNLHIYSADSFINLKTKTAIQGDLLFSGNMQGETVNVNNINTNNLSHLSNPHNSIHMHSNLHIFTNQDENRGIIRFYKVQNGGNPIHHADFYVHNNNGDQMHIRLHGNKRMTSYLTTFHDLSM